MIFCQKYLIYVNISIGLEFPQHWTQGRSYSKALGGHGPPKILKNYFILCININNFKYLATKIEVAPPEYLS